MKRDVCANASLPLWGPLTRMRRRLQVVVRSSKERSVKRL